MKKIKNRKVARVLFLPLVGVLTLLFSGSFGNGYISEYIPDFSSFPSPTEIRKEILSGSSVGISWMDHTSGKALYEIERKTGSGPFIKIGETAIGSIKFIDENLQQETDFIYRVRARLGSTYSDYSKHVRVRIDEDISFIPEAIKVGQNGKKSNEPLERILDWDILIEDDQYDVFQAPPCLEGDYYLGFQLQYDLGDFNTAAIWETQLELTLVFGQDSLWTKPIHLSSESQTFLGSIFHDVPISCHSDYRFIIQVKNSVGNVPGQHIKLKELLYKKTDTTFDPQSSFAINHQYTSPNVTVSWNDLVSGGEAYDLEWVFISDHELFNGSSAQEAFAYKAAVRITTAQRYYNHQVFYPSGKIWYRVRALGTHPDYPSNTIPGKWNYGTNAGVTVTNQQSDINWQAQTVYAEEGRYKKTVSYRDGSQRERQSIINLSSSDRVLVGEQFYDFEGRKAIQILPSATLGSSLQYQPLHNIFTAGTAAVDSATSSSRIKYHFDNGPIENSILAHSSGAGRYYSASNQDDFLHRDYIPDAEGYAYSQTEYTPDGTGRIKKQSGVGKEFRTDGNHVTRYFYGQAAPEELYRLFGSNVGDASHYKKQMVVDPNGQVSLGYMDQQGRTIATALAGDKPANVAALESYQIRESGNSWESYKVNMMPHNIKKDNTSTTVKSFLNTTPNTPYLFTYELSGLGSQLDAIGCQSCSFNLEMQLIDPYGFAVELPAIAGNASGSTFLFSKDFTAVDCIVQENFSPVTFNLLLADLGDYTLVKKLTANEKSFEQMREEVETSTTYIQQAQIIRDNYVIDESQCTDCLEDCPEAEGAILTAINEKAGQECNNIRQNIIGSFYESFGFDYEVTEADVQGHPDYCHYLICVQNQPAAVFENEISRISDWYSAGMAGYIDLINLDPFYNNPDLSGSGFKQSLQVKLLDIFIATVGYDSNGDGIQDGTNDFRGNLFSVTDPGNTAMYIDALGNPNPQNGFHLLYFDIYANRARLGEEEFQRNLAITRWGFYRTYYFNASREIKKQITQLNSCPSYMALLEIPDNLPKTDQEMLAWETSSGVIAPVDTLTLGYSLDIITRSCGADLSTQHQLEISGHLENYFNSNRRTNPFSLILAEDLYGNHPNLEPVQSILQTYGCGLNAVALANPLVCVRDTVIYVPAEPSLTSFNDESQMSSLSTNDYVEDQKNNEKNKADIIKENKKVEKDILKMQEAGRERMFRNDQILINMALAEAKKGNRKAKGKNQNNTLDDSFGTSSIQTSSVPSTAVYNALMELYQSTGGPNWTNNFGWASANPNIPQDVSGWYGLSVNNDGNLYQITLDNNNLIGQIPASIGDIPYLSALVLPNNQLSGAIPTSIGNLSYMVYINLANNQLTGSIPASIGNLTDMSVCYLHYNQLTGNIPTTVGSMVKLNTFTLDVNNLTGPVPAEFGFLQQLSNLSAAHNGLSGTIPSALGSSSKLVSLHLSYNQLTGSIPASFGSLSDLGALGLQNNLLSGSIPTQLGSCIKLQELYLANNQLSGSLPASLNNLVLLKNLLVGSNSLGGILPSLASLTSLINLHLYDNSFSGNLTSSVGSLTSLENMLIYGNQFTGQLPASLSNLQNLQRFHAGWNLFEGNIPSNMICSAPVITEIRLNNNTGLRGALPSCFANTIGELDLSHCSFTFSDILPISSGYAGAGLFPSPQMKVDTLRYHTVPEGSGFSVQAAIDMNTLPSSKFQWFRRDGQSETPMQPSATVGGHTLTFSTLAMHDAGTYFYRITNDNLPSLVLESKDHTLEVIKMQEIRYCLQFIIDPLQSPGLAPFTFVPDFTQLAAQCLEEQVAKNNSLIEYATEVLLEEWVTSFYTEFRTRCLEDISEQLTYTYTPKEYHYTLYYYDQAGNLVQTTPPQGVQPLDQAAVSAVAGGSVVYPDHTLNTRYGYNSRDQLIWQQTPDAGGSKFWYNRAGQLRLSQNARQVTDSTYSYTRYDAKGRVTEVGELQSAESIDNLKDKINTLSFPDLNEYTAYDITKTVYDRHHTHADSTFLQENLRGRVSWTAMIEKDRLDTVITLYSYDIHGNVKGLLQQLPGLAPKRTEYVYDLVSGNVNYVMYQYGYEDQFIHRYSYDADNRIEDVHTSTDGYIWNREATYHYYPHGPLARVELGEYNVQGLDYYYTLQGWLKGVNMPGEGDPGGDGLDGLRTGKDAFAFTLGYHANDFKPINPNAITSDGRDQLWTRYDEQRGITGLYNGNIAWMNTDLPGLESKPMQAMLYHYDQLHRIVEARSLTAYSAGSGFISRSSAPNAYDVDYSYDANGNLLTLQRRNGQADMMDDFKYSYYSGTNRLKGILSEEDYKTLTIDGGTVSSNDLLYQNIIVKGNAQVPSGSNVTLRATEKITLNPDFKVQEGGSFSTQIVDEEIDSNYYQYDAIGNLVRDLAEGIEIQWTPYGKIRSVSKSDGTKLEFRYDATGQRIEKKVGESVQRYVRDASGIPMAIYEQDTLMEQSVFGSSRLGIQVASSQQGYRTLGGKKYELSNHLGNVLAVVTDNIHMDQDSTWSHLRLLTDYYPFGLAMEGRSSQDTTLYRYGFNGMEKDEEWKGDGRSYDFGARIYDPRVGRWLSVDPMAHLRGWVSPYNFVQNNPILRVDPDGMLDHEYTIDTNTGERRKISELGGDDIDFIHYGEYQDNGTAFIAKRTVQAEKATPKESLGFIGEKIKSQVNSDFEKYTFERYWKGRGDLHLQVSEFENIVANAKVEKEMNSITLNNKLTVIPKLVSLYGSNTYDAALGRATVLYNEKGTAIGLMDVYDFDSKSLGVRSFSNELKTRAVRQASPSSAKPFNIWFGIVPPSLIPQKK